MQTAEMDQNNRDRKEEATLFRLVHDGIDGSRRRTRQCMHLPSLCKPTKAEGDDDVLEEWKMEIEPHGLESGSYNARRRASSPIGFDAHSNVRCGFEEGPR